VDTPEKPPGAITSMASKPAMPTPALLLEMLRVSTRVSDLIFSPGTLPHVEVSGQLVPVKIPGLQMLAPEETRRISDELINGNRQAIATLQEQGSCDISYSIPGHCRFRVNIFMQRGSHAIVMRLIPKSIPSFADLKLPAQLAEVANLRNGIVLVTGPTGSGKSSSMAAILDRINETQAYHIITIEDPVEFMHRHKRSIIHQRELHSDTPSFALALRAHVREEGQSRARVVNRTLVRPFPTASRFHSQLIGSGFSWSRFASCCDQMRIRANLLPPFRPSGRVGPQGPAKAQQLVVI
jgi:Tfp pilus assembly ATPase PilU